MAVIKDVAKQAGVSTATVSKVINRPETVKSSTREMVLAVMKNLKYVPNPAAQSMRTKKTKKIAVLSPDIQNPFYAELYSRLRLEITKSGYTPILYSVEDNYDSLYDFLLNFSNNQVDGIILCFVDDYLDIDTLISNFETKIPTVIISWDLSNTKHNSINLDVFEGMYKATKHLIEIKHEKIAYIGGPKQSKISNEKYLGFCKAIKENNLEIDKDYISEGQYTLESGYISARKFLMLDKPPTAIVCANDILAIGCMKYLLSFGIKVPESVAVSGFDNISFASMYEPALTTVSIPINEICVSCAKMLSNMIVKTEPQKKFLIVKTELIIRNSTDPKIPLDF